MKIFTRKLICSLLLSLGLAVLTAMPAMAETKQKFISQDGLTWMPIGNSAKTWPDANAYCNNTAINGQTGWRLPTKKELSALYNSGSMKDQGWTLFYTWSSTSDSTGSHYSVHMFNGYVVAYDEIGNSNLVTCVH